MGRKYRKHLVLVEITIHDERPDTEKRALSLFEQYLRGENVDDRIVKTTVKSYKRHQTQLNVKANGRKKELRQRPRAADSSTDSKGESSTERSD